MTVAMNRHHAKRRSNGVVFPNERGIRSHHLTYGLVPRVDLKSHFVEHLAVSKQPYQLPFFLDGEAGNVLGS